MIKTDDNINVCMEQKGILYDQKKHNGSRKQVFIKNLNEHIKRICINNIQYNVNKYLCGTWPHSKTFLFLCSQNLTNNKNYNTLYIGIKKYWQIFTFSKRTVSSFRIRRKKSWKTFPVHPLDNKANLNKIWSHLFTESFEFL